MPDPNNPLESTLRAIRDVVGAGPSGPELSKIQMTLIRASLINYRNLEVQDMLDYWAGRKD